MAPQLLALGDELLLLLSREIDFLHDLHCAARLYKCAPAIHVNINRFRTFHVRAHCCFFVLVTRTVRDETTFHFFQYRSKIRIA
jgi:hypothetical protein